MTLTRSSATYSAGPTRPESQTDRNESHVRIRIIGAGVMGRGIAQWAATAGHTVELAD
ncbi:3-hydroxyacyl-CoA dehydrogenase NAD-binding domain-containing protein, partial [Streptomyces sp. NPDC004393]